MERRARALAAALLFCAALGAATAAFAAPGDLDTTFSGDGLATTNFGVRGAGLNDIAIDSQGRVVAAGYGNYHGSPHDLTLARYLPNGSPDPSFSGDGKLRTHFSFTSLGEAVAIDSQGRIVVVGNAGGGFFFARFLPNGRFDPSFSGDGRCRVTFGGQYGSPRDVAIDHRGRIVAVGAAAPSGQLQFAVVRLNVNGTRDRSFDSDGRATIKIASRGEANSVAIDSLGRIVVGGSAVPRPGATVRFAVARLLSSGTPDPAFSGDGRDVGGIFGEATSLAIDDQNRVVAAGRGFRGRQSFAVARYRSDGSLDPSFSGDGKTVTQFADDAHANSVALDADGRIVVAGFTPHNPTNFALARYDPSGDLDSSFGRGGRVETNLGGNDLLSTVAIDAQGRIVGGGDRRVVEDGARESEFAVVRYLAGP